MTLLINKKNLMINLRQTFDKCYDHDFYSKNIHNRTCTNAANIKIFCKLNLVPS